MGGKYRGSTSSSDSECDGNRSRNRNRSHRRHREPSLSDHLQRHHMVQCDRCDVLDDDDRGSLTVIEETAEDLTPNSETTSMRGHIRTESCFPTEHAVQIRMDLIDSEIMRIAGSEGASSGRSLSAYGHHSSTGGVY